MTELQVDHVCLEDIYAKSCNDKQLSLLIPKLQGVNGIY